MLVQALILCSLAIGQIYAQMTQEQRDTIVKALNDRRSYLRDAEKTDEIRRCLFPAGFPFNDIEYDMELEITAQNLANRCLLNADSQEERHPVTVGTNPIYENIGQLIYGSYCPSTNKAIDSALHSWWDQYKTYTYGDGYYNPANCMPGERCGGFIQMAWNSTTRVGCGVKAGCPKLCPHATTDLKVVVCNFAPGGGVTGEKIYEKDPSIDSDPPVIPFIPDLLKNLTMQMSRTLRNQFKDGHNWYRNRLADGTSALVVSGKYPKANPFQEMKYNLALEQSASVWASKCIPKHDTMPERRPIGSQFIDDAQYNSIGQNIYYSTCPPNLGCKYAESAMQSWFEEWKDWDFQDGKFDMSYCKDGKMCGHFTQMIWNATTQIGCGLNRCKPGPGLYSEITDWVMVVCNYMTGGNKMGSQIYTPVGEGW